METEKEVFAVNILKEDGSKECWAYAGNLDGALREARALMVKPRPGQHGERCRRVEVVLLKD